MPGAYKHKMTPVRSITSIPSNISACLADMNRGVPNVPILTTSEPRAVEGFGWYDSDKYSLYEINGGFDNGLESVYISRVVGSATKCALGGNGYKVGPSKALLDDGAANAQLYLQAKTAGITGLDINATIETAAVNNYTTVSLSNLHDITIDLAKTDAWRKTAKVVAYVANGHSMYIVAGHAVPAVGNSVCFYAKTAGAGGDYYSVEIVDSGGAGPSTYTYSGDGKKLTIDLVGLTPTAAAVVIAVNALAGGIEAFEADGAGAGIWNLAVVETNLANGTNSVAALVNGTWGGTGLTEKVVMAKTFLTGTGATAGANKEFTDTSGVDPLAAVTDKCIPNDVLVIYNGANKGAYYLSSVPSEVKLVATASANFDAQTGIIWAILGTASAYGHLTSTLKSPGDSGDNFFWTLTKEYGGATLKAVLSVLDGDAQIRELESYSGLSPIPTNSDFAETRINANSYWASVDIDPMKTLTAASDGATVALGSVLTSASSTFISDGVRAGELMILESGADKGVYEIFSVDTEHTLTVTTAFTATVGALTFAIRGVDSTGSELLALVGSSGLTMIFGGGVDDTPTKADYEGSESAKTGVYALNKIPIQTLPSKFWVPEAPVVVDSSGVDATDALNASMNAYANSKEYLVYVTAEEFGHTPTTVMAAVDSQSIDSDFYATYWPWGKVSDPITGRDKWIPPTGHILGMWDRVGSGPEGIHKAPANEVLYGFTELEYDVDDPEADLLDEMNINVIRNMGYYTAWGANLMTSDADYRPIHKRRVIIRTVMSIVRNLQRDLTFGVNAVSNWGKAKSKVDSYCAQFDRRNFDDGCFENKVDPSAQPWYVICGIENNDLAGEKLNLEHGFCIVDMIKEIHYYYGLWKGGFSITQGK